MSVAFLAEYSAFKLVEHSTEESSGYSANLRDISKERILINNKIENHLQKMIIVK